jgi:hypothetical protein
MWCCVLFLRRLAIRSAGNANSTIRLTNVSALASIGSNAFDNFVGSLVLEGACPDLRIIRKAAFHKTFKIESLPAHIELRHLSGLEEIGRAAFQGLEGDVLIEGNCATLLRIGRASFQRAISSLSKVNLSELRSLVTIEHKAFDLFGGAITLTGRFPMLSGIGFQAFSNAANPLNIINLHCISPGGLSFLDSADEAVGLEHPTLQEAAFTGYVGQQDTDRLPRGCGVYTCDPVFGDVPLTKESYASMMAAGGDGFDAVTCIPTEEFMEYDAPLSLSAKMPNLVNIGDRAFFNFKGSEFAFLALNESYLPRLERIGAEVRFFFRHKFTLEDAIGSTPARLKLVHACDPSPMAFIEDVHSYRLTL